MLESTRTLWRTCRFHLRVGARLALAVLVPAVAVTIGVMAFLREDFVEALGLLLFGATGSLPTALVVLGSAVAVAAVAAPRVCAGLGWLRHLPVAGASQRRAVTAAVALAQAPWLAILALLVAEAAGHPGAATAAHLAGLPVIALAAAQLALQPWRRPGALPPAIGAGLLAGLGSWLVLAAALALVAASDLAAGPPLRRSRRTAAPAIGAPAMLAALAAPAPRWSLPARIGWRALGWGRVRAYAIALVPWLAANFFSRNNQLSPTHAARAALLGGAVSCVCLLAALAVTLGARRPAWPWSRSLPWSARQRVLGDAVLLGAHAVPLLALTAAVSPAAVPALAALLPLLAVRAAGALRRPVTSRQGGAAGEIVMEGLLLAGLAALLPWAAAAMLAAVPLALRTAAARERRQKLGAWHERQHLAAGDPQSWSGD